MSRKPLTDTNRDDILDPGDCTAWFNNYATGCP